MWLDPVSARAVLRADNVHLVPLDATASLPITQDYVSNRQTILYDTQSGLITSCGRTAARRC